MNEQILHSLSELLYFQMNMLQAEIRMQGMIAENKLRTDNGQSIAYEEEAFEALINEFGIHHNKFPFCP
jgi:hypothetical protein